MCHWRVRGETVGSLGKRSARKISGAQRNALLARAKQGGGAVGALSAHAITNRLSYCKLPDSRAFGPLLRQTRLFRYYEGVPVGMRYQNRNCKQACTFSRANLSLLAAAETNEIHSLSAVAVDLHFLYCIIIIIM